MQADKHSERPRVVILGAGFAGLDAALRLSQIYFLIGSRNRVVAANWFWSCLTFGRGIRLIIGDVHPGDAGGRVSGRETARRE